MEKFVIPQESIIKKIDRRELNGHSSVILWFTGLSGAGKSTLAYQLDARLYERGVRTFVLDGDNVRTGLNSNLGFSAEDRKENIRRVGEVAKLFMEAGMMAITAFISPYAQDRDSVSRLVKPKEFIEIYVKCPIEVCEQRDVKGHYQKARAGIIKQFTGISAPYEEPKNPEIVLETHKKTVDENVQYIIQYLEDNNYLIEQGRKGRFV